MRWNSPTVRTLIRLALEEDAARHDITSSGLIPSDLKLEAQIKAKQSGVICGLPMAQAVFKVLDPKVSFKALVREGQTVHPGTSLARLLGSARTILAGERTALNAVQHLSGIATYTRQQVKKLGSRHSHIYDTRKTLPGWRELQKYAVACGGGKNHRMSLADGILIKENHLKICRSIGWDWMRVIQQFRKRYPKIPVEMEIQTSQDVRDAMYVAPQQILLDNMKPPRLRQLIKYLRSQLPQLEIEVSGGIRSNQLPALRSLPVERISMGRLTQSAPAFDCSLDITHVFHPR